MGGANPYHPSFGPIEEAFIQNTSSVEGMTEAGEPQPGDQKEGHMMDQNLPRVHREDPVPRAASLSARSTDLYFPKWVTPAPVRGHWDQAGHESEPFCAVVEEE